MSTKNEETHTRAVEAAHEIYLAVAQAGPPMPALQAGAFERYVSAALVRARDTALEEAACEMERLAEMPHDAYEVGAEAIRTLKGGAQ